MPRTESSTEGASSGPNHSVLVHLYRGELGRMTQYRLRLDTTTNWALGMNAALLTLGIRDAELPHEIFGLALLLTLGFMWTEARRYRAYELIRRRVRMLETAYYGQILGGDAEDDDWQQKLRRDLLRPDAPMSRLKAASIRLRRIYLWLILIVYGAWVYRLVIDGGGATAAQVGLVPGLAVLAAAGALLLGLTVLAYVHPAPEEG